MAQGTGSLWSMYRGAVDVICCDSSNQAENSGRKQKYISLRSSEFSLYVPAS